LKLVGAPTLEPIYVAKEPGGYLALIHHHIGRKRGTDVILDITMTSRFSPFNSWVSFPTKL
jgi:hypothetical protein